MRVTVGVFLAIELPLLASDLALLLADFTILSDESALLADESALLDEGLLHERRLLLHESRLLLHEWLLTVHGLLLHELLLRERRLLLHEWHRCSGRKPRWLLNDGLEELDARAGELNRGFEIASDLTEVIRTDKLIPTAHLMEYDEILQLNGCHCQCLIRNELLVEHLELDELIGLKIDREAEGMIPGRIHTAMMMGFRMLLRPSHLGSDEGRHRPNQRLIRQVTRSMDVDSQLATKATDDTANRVHAHRSEGHDGWEDGRRNGWRKRTSNGGTNEGSQNTS